LDTSIKPSSISKGVVEILINIHFARENLTTRHTQGDEDITNMDTPTVVTYNSKVKLFFSIIIFNTCVQCHLQKYLHGSKKVWIMHGKDGL
jgi:hypothetical protein